LIKQRANYQQQIINIKQTLKSTYANTHGCLFTSSSFNLNSRELKLNIIKLYKIETDKKTENKIFNSSREKNLNNNKF
jgi:hypothetical protein